MILQVTLTVSEAKRIIARAAFALPEMKKALENGKVLLKGGTTVSFLAELMIGQKLGICGRISPRGAKGPPSMDLKYPHSVLVEGGKVTDIDDRLEEAALSLSKDDIFVFSANAIDKEGNAAMMAGSPLGGEPGRVMGALGAEGTKIIIIAGLEKLIPCSIAEAARACGRKRVDLSFGMAVGLIPVFGKLITEIEAFEILANVRSTVIGKGGVCGAEGSTTMVVEGDKESLRSIYKIISEIKHVDKLAGPEVLEECKPGNDWCEEDLGCIYSKGTRALLGGDSHV